MLLFWILSAMNNEMRIVGPSPNTSVVGTMANFLGWALFIVSLMILWYVIKFFWVTPAADKAKADQEWKESGEGMRNWIGKMMKDKKEADELKRKKL